MDYFADIPVPPCLTGSQRKTEIYATDTYFREAISDFSTDQSFLFKNTMMLMKPDALAGRRLGKILDAVCGAGFSPLAVRTVPVDRCMFRAMWWYQHNVATLSRLAAMDRLFSMAPSILMMLADDTWATGVGVAGGGLPASVRLAALKGSADPSLQKPGQIRYALQPPNVMFNFIHTADEPIDVARELGVLFTRQERHELIAEAEERRPKHAQVRETYVRLESDFQSHDLDPEVSKSRLAISGLSGPRLVSSLFKILENAGYQQRWDALAVLSNELPFRLEGTVEKVGNVSADSWRSATSEANPS